MCDQIQIRLHVHMVLIMGSGSSWTRSKIGMQEADPYPEVEEYCTPKQLNVKKKKKNSKQLLKQES